jgi:two-component sensor histidine kinase
LKARTSCSTVNTRRISLSFLHELATNATKYGALSNLEGGVHVTWGIKGDGWDSQLTFHWREQGGPPVVAPKRRGFGSRLLSAMFANTRSHFDRNGFGCDIEEPLRAAAPGTLELETGR